MFVSIRYPYVTVLLRFLITKEGQKFWICLYNYVTGQINLRWKKTYVMYIIYLIISAKEDLRIACLKIGEVPDESSLCGALYA